MWKCPIDGELSVIGMAVGEPMCSKHGCQLVEVPNTYPEPVQSTIHVGAKVSIGGNTYNSGKIKVQENGELKIEGDLINSGDLLISDPEKLKQLLIEIVKSSKSVAELGSKVIDTFFGR